MSNLYSNSIFLVDTEKIRPNPYQPRKDFDEFKLQSLADSIKQYGVLQPLIVSRLEVEKGEGGLITEYELVAGERRLRASKLAGISQVPVIIRTGDSSLVKLELAILENLQREDLNVVDRARAFSQLVNEFKFTHGEVGKKMGKSREYISNTLRILNLPEQILNLVSEGKISDGHTKPLLMLADHPEEQLTLSKEIIYRKITVRESEKLARKIAYDRVRKKERVFDPEILELEEEFQEKLGTRVHIERRELGGQIKIDYFSNEDLHFILDLIQNKKQQKNVGEMMENYIVKNSLNNNLGNLNSLAVAEGITNITDISEISVIPEKKMETALEEDNIYDIQNFSV